MANPWFHVSSGIFDHFGKIGSAIWVFLWLVHHEYKPETDDEDKRGLVNKGDPVTYDEIAAEIPGLSRITVRRHARELEEKKYIRSKQIRGGKCYWIAKPYRWRQNGVAQTESEVINDDHSDPEVITDEQPDRNRVIIDEQPKCSPVITQSDHPRSAEVITSDHRNKEARTSRTCKNKTIGADAPSLFLPDWLPLGPWKEFLEMRKRIRKPPTPYAQTLLLKKLSALRDAGHDPAAVLNKSTISNWQDVYELKEARNGNGNGLNKPRPKLPNPAQLTREREREMMNA